MLTKYRSLLSFGTWTSRIYHVHEAREDQLLHALATTISGPRLICFRVCARQGQFSEQG